MYIISIISNEEIKYYGYSTPKNRIKFEKIVQSENMEENFFVQKKWSILLENLLMKTTEFISLDQWNSVLNPNRNETNLTIAHSGNYGKITDIYISYRLLFLGVIKYILSTTQTFN